MNKLERLKSVIKKMDSALVAFSGGVDSTFLLKVAKDVLKEKVIAVTARSESYPKSELKEAKILAKKIGVKHIIIDSKETEIKEFQKNPMNRCYFCKKELIGKLKKIATKNNIKNIFIANNYDDISDYRPGIEACNELGARSPLIEAKLTKKEIRELSKELKLETWDKPSYACLASRFPYGSRITREKLRKIEKAEEFIRNFGISQIRVRDHGNIARIEIEKKDFPLAIRNAEKINDYLKKLGFRYISLDLAGYRTGSMNEELKKWSAI